MNPAPQVIIAMTGLARSGKDTVGTILVREHGFTRVSFGDGIRDAALGLDPIVAIDPDPDQELTKPQRLSSLVADQGWETAKAVPEVRRTLQRLGSEAGWMLHGPDLWIELASKKIAAIDGPVVITDLRFAHETAWLDRVGGRLWKTVRPGNEQSLTGAQAAHASEAGDLGREPDLTIDNSGTLDDLARLVSAALPTRP